MASIRMLKKSVDDQIFEIISDCFLFSGLHPDNKTEDVASIIEDAVTLRNDLFSRINNPVSDEDPKALRKHLAMVKTDLSAGVVNLCERLSAVSSKKKKK
jgi:hypothetical protein